MSHDHIADHEDAGVRACQAAAKAAGISADQADNCEDGEHKCPACPWKKAEAPDWVDVATVDELERFYLSRLPAIREAAQAHGYAIGVHGSLRRDMDLIAAPWRDGASDADALAHAVAMAACGIDRAGPYEWERKPAGRVATSIPICWPAWHGQTGAGHIDLSVMPKGVMPAEEGPDMPVPSFF